VTPYLAAVVKGTNFRVSVDRAGSQVQVLRGQVDVADFHSGEQVLLLPSQEAKVAAAGDRTLAVSGSGLFNPVRVGPSRPQPFAPEQPNTKTAALDQPASAQTAPARAALRDSADGMQKNWKESAKNLDPLTMLTVPASLGLLVSFAVAVGRGLKRRSKKDQDNSRR
jgi:hypothetical protein